jgi:hypothetical protein
MPASHVAPCTIGAEDDGNRTIAITGHEAPINARHLAP